MTSLLSLFLEHAGNISDKLEHYLAIYEAELAPFRDAGRPISLLEIGVQNGGSLQIFAKYLPEGSNILGLDVDTACAKLSLGANIRVAIADASVPPSLEAALGDELFDLILDDGSHRSDQIITAVRTCFDHLKPGGLYIVEDLHASYWTSHGGGFQRSDSAIEHLKALVDALNIDHIPSDAWAQASKTELDWLRHVGTQLARVTFYNSIFGEAGGTQTWRLPSAPYRSLRTGFRSRYAYRASISPSVTEPDLCTCYGGSLRTCPSRCRRSGAGGGGLSSLKDYWRGTTLGRDANEFSRGTATLRSNSEGSGQGGAASV